MQDPWLDREKQNYQFPLPSREYILQILTDQGVPVLPIELMNLLEIRNDEETLFIKRLAAMERDGQIIFNRKGAICIAEKIDLIVGKVQGHADGFGFCLPEDGSSDLFLSAREMQKVMHGDKVLVREVPGEKRGGNRTGKREGIIIEVLERAQQHLVGRIIVERGIPFVLAEDKRISHEILLPKSENSHLEQPLQTGQIVMVSLIQQPSKYAKPIGKVTEVLGNYADPGMEIEIALRKHNLPHIFSDEVEATKIPKKVRKKDKEGRVDLTSLPLVTIDGETAKDFDDAVFCEPQGKGWRLVVAIADVSFYVTPGTALDEEAKARGNSVYFPRRVIPMLPEALSNGICSLNPAVERLCMVCDMQINKKGEIKKYEFYEAVMFSQARLTYTKVANWLAKPEEIVDPEAKALLPHLQHLNQVFDALKAARDVRGAIDFDTTETQMIFNDQGKIETIVPVVRNDAHRLIEECMLAANVCAADIILKHKHPCLFRNHDVPSPDKQEKLRTFLRETGLGLGGGEKPTAKDYAQLMEKIRERPDAGLMQTVLLRSLMQAQYEPDNIGHFGLGYEAYTHFTSPIRRYPDLLVHRTIKAILAGKKYKAGNWTQLGEHCSMTERRADEASRDVENWLKCYFMQDKVGEVYAGTISAATAFGIFVLLDDIYIEGLVHISELGRDYFHFDPIRHQLLGEKTGVVYQLGSRVTIKVVRVDMETNKIDFVLVDEKSENEETDLTPQKKPRRKNSTSQRSRSAATGKSEQKSAAPTEPNPRPPRRRAKSTAKPRTASTTPSGKPAAKPTGTRRRKKTT
ncbi:ribonuclease R [Leeia sp. TBRC 13508]|uniref:Ribonuclease R n=1 Tax=Leeia speluncae TaxID=2884804 RepID=A0ABS8D2P3_9NEIS|nr:ribonuclease R [Leeia speluncae]MCB6182449.1 ribonuclease R [Leeia speluncae]